MENERPRKGLVAFEIEKEMFYYRKCTNIRYKIKSVMLVTIVITGIAYTMLSYYEIIDTIHYFIGIFSLFIALILMKE